jgi:hypothetical protein
MAEVDEHAAALAAALQRWLGRGAPADSAILQ